MPEKTHKLLFFAWLELPYFVGLTYDKVHHTIYQPYRQSNIDVPVRIMFRNDLLRIATSNKWTRPDYTGKRLEDLSHEDIWVPRYSTEIDLPRIKEMVERHSLPYLHIDRPETVVELFFEIDVSDFLNKIIIEHGYLAALLPQGNFFTTEIFPEIASILNAYRVATLPALRYKIYPVSEGLLDSAFIQIQDDVGKILQQWKHGFDIRNHGRSMQHHVENLGIQSRFDSLVNGTDIEFEVQFCSAYYLFHMRRWAEAMTIASGVVDALIRKTVFSSQTVSEHVAQLLWSKYRTQTEDLFNKILPALGHKKLDTEPSLWKAFRDAKDYRGKVVHGQVIESFNREEEKTILKHLNALYGVARWLSIQNGRNWTLDIEVNGELLPFF